jgi:hypothetical protein
MWKTTVATGAARKESFDPGNGPRLAAGVILRVQSLALGAASAQAERAVGWTETDNTGEQGDEPQVSPRSRGTEESQG